jgi:hypothetical protein
VAKVLDDEKTLITVQTIMMGMQQLVGQYGEGTVLLGRMEWTVELDLPLHGNPASHTSRLISGKAPDKLLWDRVWANAPQCSLPVAHHRR